MPQRAMTCSRSSGKLPMIGVVVETDAGPRRHVAGAVDQAVEEPARLLRHRHRGQVAHWIAPIGAASERKVWRLMDRKLGAVSQFERGNLAA